MVGRGCRLFSSSAGLMLIVLEIESHWPRWRWRVQGCYLGFHPVGHHVAKSQRSSLLFSPMFSDVSSGTLLPRSAMQ